MGTAIERRTIVTLRVLPADQRLVRFTKRHARDLAEWAGATCRIALQEIRRLGSEPMVEATVSVGVQGAPLWVLVEDADAYYAVAAACDRVRVRTTRGLVLGARADVTVARRQDLRCI